MAVLLVFSALLGLAVGSFLNVVAHRVPAGISLSTPPSRCPTCSTPIRARHNIPVLGWLVLRGRCASCGAPISARYPIVEALTGVLFVLVTWRLAGWALPAYLYFTAAGIALALIDLDHRRLPNSIVLPSYPVLAALLTLAAAGTGDWYALLRAGIGAVALFGFYLLLVLAYPAGMGWGDVKLAGVIGMVLGYLSWSALLIGAFGGFVLGAVAGVAVIAIRKGDRKTALPFGPFMIAGVFVALFFADPLANFYVNTFL